jgi:hypothetical protein
VVGRLLEKGGSWRADARRAANLTVVAVAIAVAVAVVGVVEAG